MTPQEEIKYDELIIRRWEKDNTVNPFTGKQIEKDSNIFWKLNKLINTKIIENDNQLKRLYIRNQAIMKHNDNEVNLYWYIKNDEKRNKLETNYKITKNKFEKYYLKEINKFNEWYERKGKHIDEILYTNKEKYNKMNNINIQKEFKLSKYKIGRSFINGQMITHIIKIE